jgi:AMMECR1 domain-containing protein
MENAVAVEKEVWDASVSNQVWKQLPDKKRFLEHLCLKAGMTRDCWKEEDITVQVYEVESFSEAPDGSRRGPS